MSSAPSSTAVALTGSPGADRAQLRRNLLGIGAGTRSIHGVNGFGAALAFVAFLAIALGTVSAVLATVVYDHRDDVGRSRSVASDGSVQAATLAWQHTRTYVGEDQVAVVSVDPLTASPPMPPGVSQLPGPGEAVVSPALHELLVEHDVPDRFGREIGRIAPEGLASPTELFAYVGDDGLSEGDARRVRGFGAPGAGPYLPIGEEIYDRDVQEFWAMAGFLCVLPGLIALASAARVADDETRRRHRLLARLGAGLPARMLIAAPRALRVGGISLVLCLTLLAGASAFDVTLPFTGYVLEARVVQRAAVWLAVVIVGAHVVTGVALSALTAGRLGQLAQLDASRLVVPADRPARRRTVCLIVVLALQPWVVLLVDHRSVVALSTLVAAGLAVICLPAALATILQAVARRRGTIELSRRGVGDFLGWRITGYRARALARLIGTVTSLVIVVGHATVVLTLFAGPDVDRFRAAERIGTSVLAARTTTDGVAGVTRFAAERGIAPIGIQFDLMRGDTVIVGECPSLRTAGLDCTDGPLELSDISPRMAEALAWFGSSAAQVRVGAPAGHAGEPGTSFDVVLFSPDGEDLDDITLGRDADNEIDAPVTIERLGAATLGGALDLENKSRWIYLFGVPGLLGLLVVGALTWAAVVVEESRTLVRSPLLVDRDDVYDAISKVRLALPIALGGIGGAIATVWLLLPHAGNGAVQLPVTFLIGALAATLLSALGVWWLGRRILSATSRRQWGPR